MGGIVDLNGGLTAGPPAGNCFPQSSTQFPFALQCSPMPYSVGGGALTRRVNSPTQFSCLSGVGPQDDVTNCTLFAWRLSGPVQLRVTQLVPGGPNIVSVLSAASGYLEVTSAYAIVLLEVMGVGNVEYVVFGPS
jgi:hypothetical protein